MRSLSRRSSKRHKLKPRSSPLKREKSYLSSWMRRDKLPMTGLRLPPREIRLRLRLRKEEKMKY
jgi:hypothetical protein